MNGKLASVGIVAAVLWAGVAAGQEKATTPATPALKIGPPGTQVAPESAGGPKKVTVYDEKADAKQQIAAALAKAKANNRRVLIQWGGNWCGWCVALHGLYGSDAKIKNKLLYEYDVVYVDVGMFNKHMDVAKGYGADLKASGLPFLTVLDSAGKALVNQETSSLENADKEKVSHDPKKVLEFLTKNQAPYQEAQPLIDAAMVEAKKSGKRIFLHFGAPWCVWCHRLEDWMDRKEVRSAMDKDFVDLKIDMDRNKNAKAVAEKYRADKGNGGIPWFCVLDADGTKIIDSDAPGEGTKAGNIGFPSEPHEIAHFKAMLKASCKKLTGAEIDTLCATLEKKN